MRGFPAWAGRKHSGLSSPQSAHVPISVLPTQLAV